MYIYVFYYICIYPDLLNMRVGTQGQLIPVYQDAVEYQFLLGATAIMTSSTQRVKRHSKIKKFEVNYEFTNRDGLTCTSKHETSDN